jgi:glycosyltransferase involved in cell wall biosynthesis
VLTIIIPCYNTASALLAETLDSINHSTWRQLSIIIIDDGSTQTDFLGVLNRAHFPVKLLRHPTNLGLPAARNTGVAHCVTPFFLQLDSDDCIAPTFIEKALWALASHPEWQFVNSWVQAFGAQNYTWERGFQDGINFLAENQTTATTVIRLSADRAVAGHDIALRSGAEDWEYWLRHAAYGHWGGTITEHLTFYRHFEKPNDWPTRDNVRKRIDFRHAMRQRYPKLWQGHFPKPVILGSPTARSIPVDIPYINPIPKPAGVQRVLLIVPWLNLGGADRFNLNLVRQLTKHNHQFTIVTTLAHEHPWRSQFAECTPDIFSLDTFLRSEDYPRFLRYLIESRAIDIVLISNSMLGYSLLPYLRAYCPHTLFIDYNHMVTNWLEGGYVRIGVNSQAQLDLNVVSAEQVRDWMVAEAAVPDRIAVCYINQDTQHWNPARFDRPALQTTWQLPANRPVILYPARLEPQKRPKLLVEIIVALRKVYPDFICLVAGNGPQRAWLLDAIRRHKLQDHLRFLGAVAPEKMQELYAVSDILLLPSQHEGISQAIYEAMAMAVVPVSALVGGQAELVVSGTGFLVPHGDQELTEYVGIVLRLLQNPTERAQIGQAARQRIIDHFNLDQLGERMLLLFEQARSLAAQQPRQPLSQAAADTLAARVVDDVKYERLQERLRLPDPLVILPPDSGWLGTWRKVIFQLKKKVFRPLYYWALRHGFDAVVPLAERLYRSLNWLFR